VQEGETLVNNSRISAFKASTASIAIGLTVLAASPALAQAAQPEEAEPQDAGSGAIVVTGSRISNPAIEQSSPVSVISEEELSLAQPVNAEEFLRELPGSAPGIGAQVNNGANGSATVNLRGLGTNRNLVLLNGRRIVPATLGAVVDTNVIPVGLIERVDVFTGGASSVYGADAISGVVNFITKQDFAGINLSANYGITERGDGANYRTDLLVGANFDDGRGNVVLGVGYNKTRPVLQGERDIGLVSRSSNTGLPQGSSAAAPATIFAPIVGVFDPANGRIDTSQLGNYNFNPLNVFQTPFEKFSIYGSGRYEISSAIELFSEAFFSRTEIDQIIAPSATFFNAFKLPLNNRFLTPTQANQICIGAAASIPGGAAGCPAAIAAGREVDAIIARRFVEAGPRRTNFTTNTYQIVAGVRGTLTENLDWELSGQYGQSNRVNSSSGQGLQERFQQSIRGCPAGSAPGCTPINIFGGPGSITPQAFTFLDVTTNSFINTELGAVQALVTGDLGFSSPFAREPIGIAIGGDYRRYEGSQRGDLPSSTPGAVLGAGGAFVPVEGEYNSKEVYGEIIIPLVEDRPFFHNLTLEAGARYADYSTTGGDWTYKAGGSFSPVPDIKFRGLYSRAVRAPNIGELFAPINTVLSNRAIDPCQGTRDQITARGANFIPLCEAQVRAVGLPASTVGTITPPAAGQINVTGGGNPDLDPEIATTYTLGVVVQPRFLPGFTATADYYNIKVRDAISSPSQSDIIDGCFQANSVAASCGLIFRNPLTGSLFGDPGTTRGPLLQASNLGRIETAGVDFTASYRHDFDSFGLNFAFNGNYTDRSRFQATPASINRECVRYYSVSCDPVLPKWTWNFRTTAEFDQITASLLWRHIGRTQVEPVALPAAQRPPVDEPQTAGPAGILPTYQEISPRDYFDLAFRFDASENMYFTFLVENLLDKDPPDVGNTVGSTAYNSGNTFPSLYDPLGRRYRVGVNLTF
jgi:iron complex outermembrane recepter protein